MGILGRRDVELDMFAQASILKKGGGGAGRSGFNIKKRGWRGCWQVMREFVQQPLGENNVCSSSLIALPTCVSSRWAIIPRNGRHPARHGANMPLAELITNFIIMRLGHAQSESGCVQQHAIAPPLITRKSSRHLLLQSLVLVLKGVGTTHRNQNIHKTKVRSKPSC